MNKKLLAALALTAGALGWASHANADLISIGLQEAGVNGGAITTEGTGHGAASIGPIAYGTFSIDQASAQDEVGAGPPAVLNSQSLNTSSSSAGVLHVWITAQGLTTPQALSKFLTTFAVNSLTGSITSVTESSFLDTANGLFTTAHPLATATFTANAAPPGTTTLATPGALFSATEEFSITDIGGSLGTDNLTIDLSATKVPEPASLALLGSALAGLGFLRRRRRTA